MMNLNDDVTVIKGIGEKKASDLKKLGILTVKDLLMYFPRSYETYEKPMTLREASRRDFAPIYGIIMDKPVTRYVKKMQRIELL